MAHPTRYDDADPLLARLREVCLALPEAQEKVAHGRPNFYTKKVFASFGGSLKGDHSADTYGQSVLFLPDQIERAALLADSRYFIPAYVGAYGWIGLNFRDAEPDWTEVAELVESSYRNTAVKRLVAVLDA